MSTRIMGMIVCDRCGAIIRVSKNVTRDKDEKDYCDHCRGIMDEHPGWVHERKDDDPILRMKHEIRTKEEMLEEYK